MLEARVLCRAVDWNRCFAGDCRFTGMKKYALLAAVRESCVPLLDLRRAINASSARDWRREQLKKASGLLPCIRTFDLSRFASQPGLLAPPGYKTCKELPSGYCFSSAGPLSTL